MAADTFTGGTPFSGDFTFSGGDAPAGSTIFIDLGLDRGEPATYKRPTRSTVPVWFAPLVVAFLVLISSAASAAPPPPVFAPVLRLPVAPTDSYTITDGGQLLAQTVGSLSLYDLGSGLLRWRAAATAPIYNRPEVDNGLVLLRPWSTGLARIGSPATTAISLADGAARWRRAGKVLALTGSSALFAVTPIRSLTDAGRVEGAVARIDPVTGETSWQVTVPYSAQALSVPGPTGEPARLLLVNADRSVTVHDLSTGAQVATGSFPVADFEPDNPMVSGDTILLRHPGADTPEVSGYDPVTLGEKWTRPSGGADDMLTCGPYVCLTGADGVRALDPGTGRTIWYRSSWRTLEQFGGTMVAYTSPGGGSEAIGVVDLATGRITTDLSGWRPVSGTGGRDLLVTRVVAAGARTMVAVARPGDAVPRPLAELPAGTGDCQTAPARLVCRSDAGELVIWAYRPEG
jgi:hypothetical protein